MMNEIHPIVDVEGRNQSGVERQELLTDSNSPNSAKIRRKLIGFGIIATCFTVFLSVLISTRSSTSRDKYSSPPSKSYEVESTTPSMMDARGRFVMKDSFESKTFASFLPGIGGTFGLPMWCFYVNRGQGVAAFGQTSKDYAIMEFYPANKAWSNTGNVGFRTYIRGTKGQQSFGYQPFYESSQYVSDATRTMMTGMNEFEIEEVNEELDLKTNIVYFTLTNEDFPGLVRRMTLKNTGDDTLSLEMLDGLQVLYPYGITDFAVNTIARTLEAWMNVYGVDEDPTLPFYHLISSFVDSEIVKDITMGNFALAFIESDNNVGGDGLYQRLPFVVDPAVIYGTDTSLQTPSEFFSTPLNEILEAKQVTASKTPCGLYGAAVSLEPGEEVTMTSIFGWAMNIEYFNTEIAPKVTVPGYIPAMRETASELTDDLTKSVKTSSASPIFDAYVQQNFLDNLLRGGLPIMLGEGDVKYPFHTYSRIHGDLERDYNYFVVGPTFYSNGPGNFRDVWQNRRNDVFQVPEVKDFNVRGFFSLIDSAGYNPLTVNAANFTISDYDTAHQVALASGIEDPKAIKALTELFNGPGWVPGDIWTTILKVQENITTHGDRQEYLDYAVSLSDQSFSAVFGQGFWTDHWTYGLDLVDTFLMIYPEQETELLFDGEPVPTFMAPAMVAPRRLKYVEFQGEPRQIGSCHADPDKAKKVAQQGTIWQLTADGEIFKLPVYTKMLLLATVRMAALDPQGMGLEMEGGKPGWLDALNGLPSFFGSSTPEASELLRMVRYLGTSLFKAQRDVDVPTELYELMMSIRENILLLNTGAIDDFTYWDKVYTAKEVYREATKLTFLDTFVPMNCTDLVDLLGLWESKLESGLQKAIDFNGGFVPTYFMWEATEWTYSEGSDSSGRPYVNVQGFNATVLQKFLEGPVRFMKTMENSEKLSLYEQVKSSPIYDEVLEMFKISESLKKLSPDVGRLAVFAAGWLENESVWLHMSYKWYLELLRGELYEQFWLEVQTGLCPFMDPAVYGRSLTEASSFIVSSANPDPSLWGTGFVSRLSGSTAEFLSMYNLMMAGPSPFFLDDDGALAFALKPALPEWLITEDGTISFTLLGQVYVTYHVPDGMNTWDEGLSVSKTVLVMAANGETITVEGGILSTQYAELIRDFGISAIDIYFV